MKKVFEFLAGVLGLFLLVLIIVWLLGVLSPTPSAQTDPIYVEMLDSIKVLEADRQLLISKIDSLENIINREQQIKDSLKYTLLQNKLQNEKALVDMYHWTNDEHIEFFTDQTNSDW